MPRKAREKSSTGVYHVVVKGVGNRIMFEEEHDYIKYLNIIEEYKNECEFKIYAYCLMSNHVHLIIDCQNNSIESIFRRVNTKYSVWFNMKYQRRGTLQNGRYYSEPIEDIKYYMMALRYIHQNPMKAGLEEKIGESYPWNSYCEYSENNYRLIDSTYTDNVFINKDFFVKFHEQICDDMVMDIHNTSYRIPDDVAQEEMRQVCGAYTVEDFNKMMVEKQWKAVRELQNRHVSTRQISRITGMPIGKIKRIKENAG